jgi:hypothetical protein
VAGWAQKIRVGDQLDPAHAHVEHGTAACAADGMQGEQQVHEWAMYPTRIEVIPRLMASEYRPRVPRCCLLVLLFHGSCLDW